MPDIMMMYKLAGIGQWFQRAWEGAKGFGTRLKYVGKPEEITAKIRQSVQKEMPKATPEEIGKTVRERYEKIKNLSAPTYTEAVRKAWQEAPEEFRQAAIGTGAALGGGTLAYWLGRHRGAQAEREKPWYRRMFG
jgi:hypothetical protein